MLDHWLGKKVVFEFERDDGYRSRSLVEAYFAPPAKWSKIEREAMREVRGRVLDVGCGPGRHAVYLQRKGRSEEHTSELQSQSNLVCRLLLEKKKKLYRIRITAEHS